MTPDAPRPGCSPMTVAATPAVRGVEYDVPDPVLKVSSLLAFAPLTLEPGALICTHGP